MEGLDVDRLEALGFFAHVKPAILADVRARTRANAWVFEDEVHRMYSADAEDLAEHGIRDFLGSVAPFLRREGVRIDVTYRAVKTVSGDRPRIAAASLDDDGWLDRDGPSSFVDAMRLAMTPGGEMCDLTEDTWEDGNYSLFLDDREIVVYDEGERDPWGRATRATLRLLDEILEGHRSRERAFAISDDNDTKIAFVTPEMADIINRACDPREALKARW